MDILMVSLCELESEYNSVVELGKACFLRDKVHLFAISSITYLMTIFNNLSPIVLLMVFMYLNIFQALVNWFLFQNYSMVLNMILKVKYKLNWILTLISLI